MKRRGFTLIELLVVIAIIALLMAIGMPALSRANDDAFRARCEAHLQLVRLACQEHHQDYGVHPEKLEQLVERGYVDGETLTCSKTGESFFYRQPGEAGGQSQLCWLSCVDPGTPVGERPHGSGASFLGVTGAGEVAAMGNDR